MTRRNTDPWTHWYGAYLTERAALRAAGLLARNRRRRANVAAALLLIYMLLGGVVASVAVGLVMAN